MSNDFIPKRFSVIESEHIPRIDNASLSIDINILRDNYTGVNYLFVKESNGAGLTPLLDQEGYVNKTKKS